MHVVAHVGWTEQIGIISIIAESSAGQTALDVVTLIGNGPSPGIDRHVGASHITQALPRLMPYGLSRTWNQTT